METLVIQGKYEHYKNGKIYKVLHRSNNRETDGFDIVYREVGKQKVYNQSAERFFMNVMKEGEKVPRFKLLEDSV